MKDFNFQTVAKLFNLGYLCPASEEKSSHLARCKMGVSDRFEGALDA